MGDVTDRSSGVTSLVGSDRPVRWGLVGAGAMAHGFAADLQRLPDARIQAVAARRRTTAEALARRVGAAHVHDSVEALVGDPLVDVVYIASPNHLHARHALLALAHDTPVLCEKPFALDGDQADAVATTARRRGVFCMEAMWMRFVPVVRRAAELVRDGALGEIRTLHGDFSVAAGAERTGRLFDPLMGGGALLDLGVYPLSLADLLLGPAEQVTAHHVLGPTGVDEHVAVTTTHAGGVLATSTASIRAVGPNRAVVAGSTGTMIVHGPICRPRRLTVSTHGAASSRARRLLRAVAPTERTVASAGRLHRGNGYDGEAIEVIHCLRAGLTESPSMPLAASLRVMGVIDEARARARA